MTNNTDLRQQLDAIATWVAFFEMRQLMAKWQPDEIYRALFPLAISGREGNAPHRAGCLLIELQPDCSVPLSEIVLQIHNSKWYVSFREVPFYLVTQFGKPAVLDVAQKFLDALPPNRTEHSRVETLVYWASFSASDLCKGFHEWEFERFNEEAKNEA